MRNKFIIFILVSGILLALAGFYYYEKNVYSKEVVRLEILGKEEPQAFEEIEYSVKYKNNGNVVLEDAELVFQFPDNSLPTDEENQRVSKSLEDIYPGEERTVTFRARLVGREGETKKAEAVLRYRPKNLKPFYESQTTFTSRIQSIPLTFEIDLPSRIESGKEVQFFLNYFSNSDLPIADLRVKIEYPSGFEFLSAKPLPLEKTEWDLPLLNKTEGGRIEIKGRLLGEVKEQKIFKATLGLWRNGEFVLFKEISRGAEILRPALSVSQQINGNPQYIASAGALLHYEIFFRNIGQEPFQDLFLVAKLEGQAFDFNTLRTELGQFNSGDNYILWDWREISRLKFLDTGQEGKVEFWITLKKDWEANSQEKNFSLKNQVIISQVREDFETKINSRLEVVQKAYFSDEVFGNTGFSPPQAGESTTYTIIWQAENYYNDAKNVTLRATLPPQTRLTGKIFPEGAPLTFDSISREIVWTLGDIEAGTGKSKPAPSIAFQVAFIPTVLQVGQTPEIISQVKISGQDSWTGGNLQFTAPAINTSLPDDQAKGGMVR